MIEWPVAVTQWMRVADGRFDIAFCRYHRIAKSRAPSQVGGDRG